jgi:hypothetical protein
MLAYLTHKFILLLQIKQRTMWLVC